LKPEILGVVGVDAQRSPPSKEGGPIEAKRWAVVFIFDQTLSALSGGSPPSKEGGPIEADGDTPAADPCH
jgi:hypothetical protein